MEVTIIRKVELSMDEQKKYEVIKSLADHPAPNKQRAALTLGCTVRHEKQGSDPAGNFLSDGSGWD